MTISQNLQECMWEQGHGRVAAADGQEAGSIWQVTCDGSHSCLITGSFTQWQEKIREPFGITRIYEGFFFS